MITAVSIHALERMNKRMGCTHMFRALNRKRDKIEADGITEIKGWRYVARKGVLVTVLPKTKEYKKEERRLRNIEKEQNNEAEE